MDREAIAHQTAATLQGVLELTPGVVLAAPGLDEVQQVSLRAVPASFGQALTLGGSTGPSAADITAFGTAIVLDGVPLSNNANLQTLGPRGEAFLATSAGGGVDLRQIPAATLERVEVIRGVPSARYGDITNGVIVVETRAGDVAPEARASYDPRTFTTTLVGGRALPGGQTGTATLDVARTLLSPATSASGTTRIAAQLQHRLVLGPAPDTTPGSAPGHLMLDSHVDFYRLFADNPEDPVFPGHANYTHDAHVRVNERARLALGRHTSATWTVAVDKTSQRSFEQDSLVRPAMPFTDRLTPGRQTGHFIFGPYLSRLTLQGDPWLFYSRLELSFAPTLLGATNVLRAGGELRREWNSGPGYQFDIATPPQVHFNGVQGFDRPRRFDQIPAVATSAAYVDDRLTRSVGPVALDVQAGLRLDLWHWFEWWYRWPRAAALEPRLNVQASPVSWLRLRGGYGKTAKQPSLAQVYPAPEYYDVVNVNWYPPNPSERLAVLTTSIVNPANGAIGFAIARDLEGGVEVGLGRSGASLSLVRFDTRTDGAIGLDRTPSFLPREHFALTDSTIGTGVQPGYITPAQYIDTVPILIDRPANNLTLDSRGWELVAELPEFRPLRTQLEVQGSWIDTRLATAGLDFGIGFSNFQLNGNIPRSPYWIGALRTGHRTVLTGRLVHREPALGLVVTITTQALLAEWEQDVAGTDTLAWAGYVTRAGQLVPVPQAQRGDSIYRDLHVGRIGLGTSRSGVPNDWLLSLQVSKTLPLDGRFSFYAFNAFDRQGRIAPGGSQRVFQPVQFGLEVTLPVQALLGGSR